MSAALRVIRIIARLNIGGPARHVTILNRGLQKRDYETLLVYGTSGPAEGDLEELTKGLPTLRVPELGRRIHFASDLRAFARLLRLLFTWRPDVVHTHTAKAGALGRAAAWVYNRTRRKRRRALVVHTFHGHVLEGYFGPFGGRLVRGAERLLALATDRIIAISESQRVDLVTRFAICTDDKAAVVPLGLDLDDLLAIVPGRPSLRPELAIPPHAFVVGYIGRLVSIKDVPLLMKAFAIVAEREREAHLLIAGDGPLREDLERLAQRLSVACRVHFTGWVGDLPRFYATCDLIALTSLNEGTPVALIEAMASGIPTVATAVGGVPDVVVDGQTGTLVKSRDPADFATAIDALVRNEPRRQAMGLRARQVARERFGSDRLISEIDQLYRAVRS
jgi:glycosyltransferase involved in cell wall biosynthesis